MILTADFGSSVTKVALWEETGPVAVAGAPVPTDHPVPGWAEQDPAAWWSSLAEACARVESLAPGGLGSVDVIGCTGARQTMVLADADGRPLGPGILWSDARAAIEADRLARSSGAPGRSPAGIPLDAASVAAKIVWLADHDGERLRSSAWILTPRDLVAWWLTGTVATDPTMASRSGLYDTAGDPVAELVGAVADKLPPVVPSDRVTARLAAGPAATLGLATGTPVVIGAGDRPCEVLGSGAATGWPMVSWGTTANVSVPLAPGPAPRPPAGLVVSHGADRGWLLEGGLSAAGSLLDWLGRLTGRTAAELGTEAATVPPGARGVLALPWLDGARAPWWRPGAGAAFAGLGAAHGPADLARAAFESVAWDLARCLEAVAGAVPGLPPVSGMALAGGGAGVDAWLDVVTGVTALPGRSRRSGQAASAGAALLAGAAVGMDLDLDRLDPVDRQVEPDPAAVARYRAVRPRADALAEALGGPGGEVRCG
ncbi:MAG: xylulokinase [Acidimicrobiales bacterium]